MTPISPFWPLNAFNVPKNIFFTHNGMYMNVIDPGKSVSFVLKDIDICGQIQYLMCTGPLRPGPVQILCYRTPPRWLGISKRHFTGRKMLSISASKSCFAEYLSLVVFILLKGVYYIHHVNIWSIELHNNAPASF